MVATWSPAAASGYYTTQSDYYAGNTNQLGTWFAPGGDFGIADGSSVAASRFEQIFNGLDVDGRTLRTNRGKALDRVPAFDVTFSAPRSVSLLWAFGEDHTKRTIEQAQARSVRAVLTMLEKEAAYARRGRGGAIIEKVVLTAACFQHCDSRPAEHADGQVFSDPNLHTHAVVMNLATRIDGTVGALHSTVLRDFKMAAGAIYHLNLAHELRDLGYGIDRIGKNGIFEIAGVDQRLIGYFSARRAEIEAKLAESGTTSAQSAVLAAAVTKSTREHKAANQGDLRPIWRAAASENGFQINLLEQQVRETAVSLAPFPERWAATRSLPEELTQTNSIIERRELVRAVAAALVNSASPPADLHAAISGLLDKEQVVQIGQDAIGQLRYSTPQVLALEQDIVRLATDLAAESWHKVERSAIERLARQRDLSDLQLIAATNTVDGRIAIIEGAPGAGKTTCLAPIVQAHKAAGCRVIGAATAWRVANMLRDDLTIDSKATAAWMADENRGQPFLDQYTLLVVDEAGLLSSREMHQVLRSVQRSGAKVLLVGDRKQLQPIGAGPALSIVARAVDVNPVNVIVRQKDVWTRRAIAAFGRGEAMPALNAFQKRGAIIEEIGSFAAIRTLVDTNERIRSETPLATTLMIARTNAEVTAICREVRSRLIARGTIHGPQLAVEAVTPSGHGNNLMLAGGDTVRFLVRHDRLGVINGTTATVTRIIDAQYANSQPRIQADVDGRRIEFTPADIADDQGRAQIGWGYATTIFGAQGLTVDHAAVLVSPDFNRHDIYVAASRARGKTHLVIDREAVDQQIRAAGEQRTVEPRERLEWIASRLSRSGAKESTLDVIDGPKPVRVPTHPRQRTSEASLEA